MPGLIQYHPNSGGAKSVAVELANRKRVDFSPGLCNARCPRSFIVASSTDTFVSFSISSAVSGQAVSPCNVQQRVDSETRRGEQ